MIKRYDLQRFITAQNRNYQDALQEIKNGRKTSHWMWYVFPQITGLGFSETAKFYAIENLAEAQAYLDHEILGSRLLEISRALLAIDNKTVYQIFGSPDDLKLQSCMTLFSLTENADSTFSTVLDTFFDGKRDQNTLKIVQSL